MPNDKPTSPPTFEVHVNVPYDTAGGVLSMKLATAYDLRNSLINILNEWEDSQEPFLAGAGRGGGANEPPDES